MKNFEKYKTIDEAETAHYNYCQKYGGDDYCTSNGCRACLLRWLYNDEEKEELLPCPFCGGGATLKNSNGRVWIECSVCHFRTTISDSDSDSEVIEKWNRRVSL